MIPMVSAFGFNVVSGRRMEGDLLVDGVSDRLKPCDMCIAFTTRRYPDNPRGDGTFETHPWVVNEMTSARNWKIKTIEVREDKVKIGDANDAVVHFRFANTARDKLMSDLAVRLAELKRNIVTVRLVPPNEEEIIFRRQALKGTMTCTYRIESEGILVKEETAKVEAIKGGYFVDIEMPSGDAIVKLEVKKTPAGSWMSFGDGLIAIPIELYDT